MGDFVQELFRFDLYKRSQGKIARQVTFAALAVIIANHNGIVVYANREAYEVTRQVRRTGEQSVVGD